MQEQHHFSHHVSSRPSCCCQTTLPSALEVLKCIPAAAANKTLSLDHLHYLASAAEFDSMTAVALTADHICRVAGSSGSTPEARKVLVDELKVGGP